MKTRIAIYGGTELSAAESWFVVSLTYALLKHGSFIIITGGFLSSPKNPGDISTDFSILQGALKYAAEKKIGLKDCLETWLPDADAEEDPRKIDVERFKEGKVVQLKGESAQARRFSMVKNVDALITIKGKKHTAMILNFARTINKPALPLAFTGGDSRIFWEANKERIQHWFDFTDEFKAKLEVEKIESVPLPIKNGIIETIVQLLDKGVKKELANNVNYKKLQKEWALQADPDQAYLSESVDAVSVQQDVYDDAATDIEMEKRVSPKRKRRTRKVSLFLSYSHKDEALREQLDKHLTPLKRIDKISVWYDKDIEGGNEWDETIKEELRKADIILLLISADFIASDYIWNVELKYALKKHEQGLSKVIPIFLRKVHFENTPFSKLQGYPRNAKPITSFPEREQDEVFFEVVTGLSRDIENWVPKR